MKGRVKWFNANQGCGYIIGEDGKEYFYRLDNLPIRSDDLVEFTPGQNAKGPLAKGVGLIQKAPPPSDKSETSRRESVVRKSTVNESSNKSGCFIATAVYGNYNAPEVLVLRRFRDEKLMRSGYGRKFVRLYYRYSPPIADFLKTQPRLSGLVRKILDFALINRLR